MTTYEMEQIKTMRLQGLGYMKIGQTLGISNNTVRSFCRRNGLDGDAPKDVIFCKHCGKPIKIIPKRKPRKFCSDACRLAWWHTHRDHSRNAKRRVCPTCQKEFTTDRRQTYCSHTCYIRMRFGREVCA